MLSLQWVTVVQKICPTDGLGVSWPAQLVFRIELLFYASELLAKSRETNCELLVRP